MSTRFLTPDARGALRASVEAVEAGSAAEVVVSIRGASASYLEVDLGVGIVLAVATLAFALFSPLGFSLPSILIDPILAGALGALVSSRLPVSRRALVPRAVRWQRARTAARATFVERGVQHTRGHTGLLIYASLTERVVVLVADGGVTRAVPADGLAAAEIALTRSLAGGGLALAAAIRDLAAPLAGFLPRADDDLNELGDAVD